MLRNERNALAQSAKSPGETPDGLAQRFGWLAAVLDEMRQLNTRMHECHGAPSGRRDDRTLDA